MPCNDQKTGQKAKGSKKVAKDKRDMAEGAFSRKQQLERQDTSMAYCKVQLIRTCSLNLHAFSACVIWYFRLYCWQVGAARALYAAAAVSKSSMCFLPALQYIDRYLGSNMSAPGVPARFTFVYNFSTLVYLSAACIN